MGNAIFISYRRDDTEGEAGRLFDDLTRAFGADNVFMDVTGIRPGVDFRTEIESNVAHCGVLLAVIGPAWVSITNAAGQRRLEDPNDFVALEVASALKRDVPVIPVLVHGARMPSPGQVPAALESFCYRNSVELSHTRWNSDVQLLVKALESYVTPQQTTKPEPVHATVPVQLPAPQPASVDTPQKRPARSIILAASLVGLLAVAGALYFSLRPVPVDSPQVVSSTPVADQRDKNLPGSGQRPYGKPSVTAEGPVADALLGEWEDTAPLPGNNLGRLIVTRTGDTLYIRGLGMCKEPGCDWGTQRAVFNGQSASATFNVNLPNSDTSRTAVVTVLQSDPASLNVTINNTFQGQGGSKSNQIERLFKHAQATKS